MSLFLENAPNLDCDSKAGDLEYITTSNDLHCS